MTTGFKDQLKDPTIKNKRATRSDTTCQFLDPLKHNWINLENYSSCYLVKLIKSRLTQSNNHIKYSSGNIYNTKI